MKGEYPRITPVDGTGEPCLRCDKAPVWKVETYTGLLWGSKPTFFCEDHFPAWARDAYREQQESEKEGEA